MKLERTFAVAIALFLTMAGSSRSYAQDAATPGTTPPAAVDQTPVATPKVSLGEKVKAQEEEIQDLKTRLEALESKEGTQATATPGAAAPAAVGQLEINGQAVTAGMSNVPAVHADIYVEHYIRLTPPGAEFQFSIGGDVYNDLTINNQSFTVNSQGQTLYNFVNGDGAYKYNNGGGDDTNGFEARKAHLDFRAAIDKMFSAVVGFDSASNYDVYVSIDKAYVLARFDPLFNLEVGKFKNPLSLENIQPKGEVPFLEQSWLKDFSVAYDIGAEIHGNYNSFVDYVLEIANGQQDNEEYYDGPGPAAYDMKAMTARVFFTPWLKSDDPWLKGIGVGGGGSVDNETFNPATDDYENYTTKTQEGDDDYGVYEYANGNNLPWSKIQTSLGGNALAVYEGGMVPAGPFYHVDIQGYYYNGNFGFMGEHMDSIQTVAYNSVNAGAGNYAPSTVTAPVQLDNQAWLAEVQWVFGGKPGFTGASVDNPFNPAKGKWGALEVVGRVHGAFLDIKSFESGKGIPWAPGTPLEPNAPLATGYQQALSYGIGLNWWLDDNFKLSCVGEKTDCFGGNAPNYWEDNAAGKQVGNSNSEEIMVARIECIL